MFLLRKLNWNPCKIFRILTLILVANAHWRNSLLFRSHLSHTNLMSQLKDIIVEKFVYNVFMEMYRTFKIAFSLI